MFDGLRGTSLLELGSGPGVKLTETDLEEDTTKDEIGTQSVMNYLTSLGVDLESCEQFIVLEIVQAPALGVVRKKGFVDGWKATGVHPSITAQKTYIKERKAALSKDVSYFRKVYRAAFVAGKEENQKAVALEVALIFWDMVFSPPGMVWKTNNVNWLAEWKNFLAEKWTRSVNRDMWNQTLEFALKTLSDDTLSFWSEDGAWPGVIDDFVAWWKAKQEKGGAMETD
jgi:DCN1-like protein 1/2